MAGDTREFGARSGRRSSDKKCEQRLLKRRNKPAAATSCNHLTRKAFQAFLSQH
jgi:hypothetical protein